ncbi:hypothetical protein Ancab_011513 [Ancistrocladus abbreviatus]
MVWKINGGRTQNHSYAEVVYGKYFDKEAPSSPIYKTDALRKGKADISMVIKELGLTYYSIRPMRGKLLLISEDNLYLNEELQSGAWPLSSTDNDSSRGLYSDSFIAKSVETKGLCSLSSSGRGKKAVTTIMEIGAMSTDNFMAPAVVIVGDNGQVDEQSQFQTMCMHDRDVQRANGHNGRTNNDDVQGEMKSVVSRLTKLEKGQTQAVHEKLMAQVGFGLEAHYPRKPQRNLAEIEEVTD